MEPRSAELLLVLVPLIAFYYTVVFDTPDAHEFFDSVDIKENELVFGFRCLLYSIAMANMTVLISIWAKDLFFYIFKLITT